ncbi:MAG TPA: CoA transferase, partial [Nocardioides sp.]
LAAIGTADRPVPPLNLVGDYGGGSMFLITGILSALWARTTTGRGRVVDAAMVDGASVLTQQVLELRAQGAWGPGGREANLLDGGAPFYRTYECRDGGHVAVGAIEPQFYALLLQGLGLSDADLPAQMDREAWPELAKVLAEHFAAHERDHWAEVFAGTDACVTPVLNFDEAARHPHILFRGSLIDKDGELTAGVAPRFAHPTSWEDQTR